MQALAMRRRDPRAAGYSGQTPNGVATAPAHALHAARSTGKLPTSSVAGLRRPSSKLASVVVCPLSAEAITGRTRIGAGECAVRPSARHGIVEGGDAAAAAPDHLDV